MNVTQQALFLELYQSFIVLNYKLYEFKYGQSAEGRQRIELYKKIARTINELESQKIADLNSVYANLSIVFPALPISLLEELATNLDRLAKTQTLDIAQYTEILFCMATLTTNSSRQVSTMISLFKLQSGRHSRLDHLECKKQVIEIFKKISELEKVNKSQGRASAFATIFQKELRPLLQDTDYFKEHLEEGDDFEKAYKVNNRAYKSIKKLYLTWKKNNSSKLQKVLALWDKCLWQQSTETPLNVSQEVSPQALSTFFEFTRDIDEIISQEN